MDEYNAKQQAADNQRLAEKMLNDKITQAARQAQAGSIGMATGMAIPELSRPSLRERVADSAFRARRDARKADRMEELAMLLEKHPDIARILDLVEDLGHY
jgi:hypothetical protein